MLLHLLRNRASPMSGTMWDALRSDDSDGKSDDETAEAVACVVAGRIADGTKKVKAAVDAAEAALAQITTASRNHSDSVKDAASAAVEAAIAAADVAAELKKLNQMKPLNSCDAVYSAKADEDAVVASLCATIAADLADQAKKKALELKKEKTDAISKYPALLLKMRKEMAGPEFSPLSEVDAIRVCALIVQDPHTFFTEGRESRFKKWKLKQWLETSAPGFVGSLPEDPIFTKIRDILTDATESIQAYNSRLEKIGEAVLIKAKKKGLDIPSKILRGVPVYLGVYNRNCRFQYKVNPADEFSKNKADFFDTKEEAAVALAEAKLAASAGT